MLSLIMIMIMIRIRRGSAFPLPLSRNTRGGSRGLPGGVPGGARGVPDLPGEKKSAATAAGLFNIFFKTKIIPDFLNLESGVLGVADHEFHSPRALGEDENALERPPSEGTFHAYIFLPRGIIRE